MVVVRKNISIALEFRTFVREIILLPCQVIRRARRTTLQIIGWQPSVDRLFNSSEHDRFPYRLVRIRQLPNMLL